MNEKLREELNLLCTKLTGAVETIRAMLEDGTEEKEQVELRDLPEGTAFQFAGIEWEILSQEYQNGTFVLAKQPLFEKAFDEDNYNNWKESSLRKFLNGDFLTELKEKAAGLKIDPDEIFLEFGRDLRAEDGRKEYGSCRDRISLISTDEYRDYREFITDKDDWWWTITAYSTKDAAYSYAVRCVRTGGGLHGDSAYRGSFGVAPACVLNSSLLIDRPQQQEGGGDD